MSTTPFCDLTHCQIFSDGHRMNPIQARLLAQQPWGWRDATVCRVAGPEIVVAYPGGEEVTLWHHSSLEPVLHPGDAVRLHEGSRALSSGSMAVSVKIIAGGLGRVPTPADAEDYASGSFGIVDLSTGFGVIG